jgi:hypothetical protein
MEGNAIYDPCFVIGGADDVVCGADPATGTRGFNLKLTEPLPSRGPAQPPTPWIMELSDGSICQAATGTMAFIDGEPVRYPCPPSKKDPRTETGVLENLKPGRVWVVEKVWFTAAGGGGNPFKLERRESVTVRRVWE